MDEINKKIIAARRRVMWNHFSKVVAWTLLVSLLLIAVGIAIPKIWHLPFLDQTAAAQFWTAAWIVGGAVFGLLLAAGISITRRRSLLNVAVEVDQRFGLKSRLSSAMAMSPADHNSTAGEALRNDATAQAELIDIGSEFKLEMPWQWCLPLVAGLIVFGVLLLPNASSPTPAGDRSAAANKTTEEQTQIITAVKQLKEKIREKRTIEGLSDAELHFDAFEKQIDQLNEKTPGAKKETLVKLNDLKKQIEKQQSKLGSSKDLKASLNKLKDVGKGPAQKLSDALKSGDLSKAKKAIADLADRLQKGDLTKTERQQLKKDIDAMAKQMNAIAEAHRQRKEELKKQIAKAQARGDLDKAAQLQDKLEQAEKQDANAQRMKQMAKQLGQCAKCMKNGGQPGQPLQEAETEMKDAAQQLQDLAKQMQQMQNEMDQLQDMEDLQDAIDQAKAEMNGNCDRPGGGGDKDGPPGNGMGEGKGFGERLKEDHETGGFKTRVRGKLQKGRVVNTGTADGENLTGRTASETRAIIEKEMSSRKESVENQLLPKSQREHTKQYFQKVLDGQ